MMSAPLYWTGARHQRRRRLLAREYRGRSQDNMNRSCSVMEMLE